MLITRPAIMFSNGEIFEGQTYSSVVAIAHKLSFTGEYIRGFVTSSGNFVLPEDAAKIALEAGQIKEEKDVLEPEDISHIILDD